MRMSDLWRAGFVVATMSLGGVLTGCNIVGPIADDRQGPPTTEAQFELPEGKSVMFFIDDRSNGLPRRSLRQTIAERAQTVLLAEEPDRRVIDARAGVAVASRETATEPMDLVTLGRTVQADLIIYVTVDSFGLTQDGVNFLPRATVRMKVLDTAKDAEPRLWPPEPEGFPILIAPNQKVAVMPSTTAERSQSEIAFAKRVGESVAKVFFKHETREPINPGE